jgi:hypothetical protein
LLNVPALTKVLEVELPLKKLLPLGSALKVPLLVKVMPGPPKPARLPLVQFTVPALVVSRLMPRVPPANVATEAAPNASVPEPPICPPVQFMVLVTEMLPAPFMVPDERLRAPEKADAAATGERAARHVEGLGARQ